MNFADTDDCRPYSAKPERGWRRSHSPVSVDWVVRESRPTDWVSTERATLSSIPFPSASLFPDIEEAITRSRKMLALSDDWDEQGAQAISETTWMRAVEFLRKTVSAVQRQCGAVLAVPKISPCGNGSIDLFWKAEKFTLLINIQSEGSVDSDFYGKTADGLVVKGTFRPEAHDFGFIYWLADTQRL